MAKRIDFWAAGSTQGPYTASREGVIGLVAVRHIKEVEMYLACNKSMPDETIAKMNAALKTMAKDGLVENIAKTYR
jgi:polar amino acid transport system substrate-binding protein